jgi:uncharacterized Zn finger protein
MAEIRKPPAYIESFAAEFNINPKILLELRRLAATEFLRKFQEQVLTKNKATSKKFFFSKADELEKFQQEIAKDTIT